MEYLTPAFIVPAIIIIVVLAIIGTGYVKAPPDEAYIISGLRKNPKILIGKAGIKIPYLERRDRLIVKQISIDIKTDGYIPTKDFIGVDIDAIAKVRVMTDELVEVERPDGSKVQVRGIDLASKNFLNMKEDEICRALTDSLQGNMREIVGTVDLKELCNDRKSFGDQVQDKAQKDMNALGIQIISCNIQKITDEQNLITALGQDNMSQIKKNASIAKANADKDVAVATAEAQKMANDANVAAQTEIAEKNNALAIKQAELKRQADTARAEAEAAGQIENQRQQKTINTEQVNAQIAQAEREAELRERMVAVKEQELSAQVKKQAEADKYAAQQKAEAELVQRQKQAEAKKYEQEREAEAKKAQAEAEKFAAQQKAEGIRAQYEAEAAGIRAKGEAEAEAVRAKGLAEAEAMEKKAEAYRKYNGAAVAEMMIRIMPEMAKAIAEPISSIDKINIYGTSGDGQQGSGASQISGITPVVMKQVFDTISDTTGVDLTEILRANTYDAKVTRNVNLTGAEITLKNAEVAADAAADAAEAPAET